MRRWPLLLLASLLALGACRGEGPTDLQNVRSAQSGLRVSAESSGRGEEGREPLPASLAGIRAGVLVSYVGSEEEVPPALGNDTVGRGKALEDTELLERFVALLRIDVREMLNQKPNRQTALEEYLSSLTSHAERAESRSRSLQNREEELQDDERRLERNIRELQNDLEAAIESGEGRSTSALMSDVLDEQTRLATISTELKVVELLVNAFDDVLKPLQERLNAVRANRDALIKGVQVVDIPGVEELGIIKVEDRIRSLRSRSRN